MTEIPEDIVLKISASREPGYAKKVASAMSWRLRDCGMFKARAVKMHAINITMKAIAICNKRVEAANVILCVEPFLGKAEEIEGEKLSTALEMTVRETCVPRPSVIIDYRVSGKQDASQNAIQRLSEAITAPALEGKLVSLKCIGPSAVHKAIIACTLGRGILFQNGKDAVIVPTWVTLLSPETGATPISLINIDFWSRNLS